MKSNHVCFARLWVSVFLFIALAIFNGCGGGSSGSSGGNTGGNSGGGNNSTPPTMTSISPTTVTAGSGAVTLTVNGTGFLATTSIQVAGTTEQTTYVSSTQVTAIVPAAQLAGGGQLGVVAYNGSLSSGTPVNLLVNNPAPGTGKVSPNYVLSTAPGTITVTGSNYVPASIVQVNGSNRTTTFVSSTQLTFQLSAADLAAAQNLTISVVSPTPGGGTAAAGNLFVLVSAPTPVITQISPSQFIVGSGQTTITVYGSNLAQTIGSNTFFLTGTVMWNGTALQTKLFSVLNSQQSITATVPANLLTATGTASITVSSITSTPAVSNSLTVTITNPPPPTLTSISPGGGPVNTSTNIVLYGTNFTAGSTVALNGVTIPSTYLNSTQLKATIPASSVELPGNVSLTVTTPAPGGGTTSALPYTAYVGIASQDIAYNATDGLLYASVPGSVSGMGNSVVGIDPVTGGVMRQIFVGSNPNRLALSTDGTQLFVGLDGAGAVAQVDLTAGKVVDQFPLGGGPGIYNPPFTATGLAAVPGEPDSVAVFPTSGIVTIYDSGVARPKTSSGLGVIDTYFDQNSGALSFGATASTLYAAASPFTGVVVLTVDSTGITAGKVLSTAVVNSNIQYDNGRIYSSNGTVLDATTGNLLGTFYVNATTAASGPVVSDSTLGLAFIAATNSSSSTSEVLAYNESTFVPTGNIPFNGASGGVSSSSSSRIVRWGQNGLAYSNGAQIFILESPVVKDLSPSPSDLAVKLTAPATAATGGAISYVATVNNLGPNSGQGATLAMALDSSLIINSITPSQGTCGTGSQFTCDLGMLASGSSATVTISATPTTSGTLAGVANVNSISYDPVTTNNQVTTSTTVTGGLFGAVPSVNSISPALVQAGSATFTLTVNGSGFNSASTVNLGTTALTTTYVSPTQLTAEVDSSLIANYGWAPVTVSNPSPGGGLSLILPLTIYGVVNVPANQIVFDPYSRQLYASVPSSATTLAGNSIVTINPFTAAVGTPVAVGSQPNKLAETSDGNYLYVGLDGADSLLQYDLLQQKITSTIPLTYTQYSTSTNTPATSLATMPGTDNTLAIGISNISSGNFGIFDVTGTNTGTFRKNFSQIYGGVNPVFSDASHLFAYDSQTSGAEFYRYSVGASGLTLIDGTTLEGMGGYNGGFVLENGIVYGGAGGIANPSTTPPSQIATLSLPDFYQEGISPFGVGAVADGSTQKDFLMLENAAGTWEYALARYNTTTYLAETWLTMPASVSNIETDWTMLRFGQDGLALLAGANSAVSPQASTQILLLRGPFVTPQLLGTSTAATLSSSSTVTHGTGNALLTLTGSNFAPGVAVTWNGSYRTTTIVDATHVTVAIPASDLATAGTASVVATNPGGPASNTLTVTIN